MIDEATADRIRVFMAALPGVEGFNLMLKYGDRVEMMGVDFPIEEAAEAFSGMFRAVASAPANGEEFVPPAIN